MTDRASELTIAFYRWTDSGWVETGDKASGVTPAAHHDGIQVYASAASGCIVVCLPPEGGDAPMIPDTTDKPGYI